MTEPTAVPVCPNDSDDLHQCITNGIAWLARAYLLGDPEFRAQRAADAFLVDAGVDAGSCSIIATVDTGAKTVQWTASFDDGRTCDLFSQGLVPGDPVQ